jgi:hypothetical protein
MAQLRRLGKLRMLHKAATKRTWPLKCLETTSLLEFEQQITRYGSERGTQASLQRECRNVQFSGDAMEIAANCLAAGRTSSTSVATPSEPLPSSPN